MMEPHCYDDSLRKTLIISHLEFPLPVGASLQFLWVVGFKNVPLTMIKVKCSTSMYCIRHTLTCYRVYGVGGTTSFSDYISTPRTHKRKWQKHAFDVCGLQSSNATDCFHFLLHQSCF